MFMLKANSAFESTGKIGSSDLQFTWNDVTRGISTQPRMGC